jgi:23S rRNA (guanine745-N1)-methyltransferase
MSGVRRVPLACTVRGCGRLLVQTGRQWNCDGGHTFDRARLGYVNLLQPQDRRSKRAGDSIEAVAARARLLEAGVGRTIIDAVVERASRDAPAGAVVTELGCGGGDVLGAVAAAMDAVAIGFDLSVAAIERAARRFPDVTWGVANVDRGVPLLARSASVVLSFHGRRHPSECQRILENDGRLIVVVPAGDDLIELREKVMGQAIRDDRVRGVMAEHEETFRLIERDLVREQHDLAPAELLDALRGTYRGARTRQQAAVAGLERLRVTVASEILVFQLGASTRMSR